jgi:hypothetical protein
MNTATTAILQHQQTRRAQGVPTVSAFVGPLGSALRAWRRWTSADRQPHTIVTGNDLEDVLSAWVAAAFAAMPLVDRACTWLAGKTGRPPEVVTGEVGRMTRYDLDVLRRSLPIDAHGPGTVAAFAALNESATGSGPDPVRFVRALAEGPGDLMARVIRAVVELYPSELWPGLLLVPSTGEGEDWALPATRRLERIASTEPRVPVAVALTVEEYARLVDRSETRVATLLREGFVELRGVSGNQLEVRLRTAGVEAAPATIDRLTTNGLDEDVAEAFVAATRAVRNPTPADIESDFRSVHEGFLFEQLESMPQTAGLFRPNHPLGFRHGHKTAEGDLVAESLKLAVEVDGGFYHLAAEQYRRDRRKDWLYQREGYLVLRFLAEDVVSDLELILNTILEAAALRRASVQPTGAE